MVAIQKQEKRDWRNLEFFMPINESVHTGKDFFIRGVAINETTSRNGVTYIAEELEKAAPSFRGKPILLDHENSVKNIVGRVTENVVYNSAEKRIEFEAKIMDKQIQEMIKDGRITDVSIGTKIEDLKQNDDEGTLTAIGMEGLEISLVAVPGDPGANLATAMFESYKAKETHNLNEKGGQEEMAEKEQESKEAPEVETKAEEVAEEETEEVKEDVAEEKPQTVVNNSIDMSAVSESIKALRDEIKSLKKEMAEDDKEDKSKDPSAEVVKEPADETKGEVVSDAEEESEEVDESFRCEQAESGKGFALYQDYTSENCKFNRLVR